MPPRRPPPRAARARGADFTTSLASRLGLFVVACVGFNLYATRLPPERAALPAALPAAAVPPFAGPPAASSPPRRAPPPTPPRRRARAPTVSRARTRARARTAAARAELLARVPAAAPIPPPRATTSRPSSRAGRRPRARRGRARASARPRATPLRVAPLAHGARGRRGDGPHFVCAALDLWPDEKCDFGACSWRGASALALDLASPPLRAAVRALAPLMLRVGGSLQDLVVYRDDARPQRRRARRRRPAATTRSRTRPRSPRGTRSRTAARPAATARPPRGARCARPGGFALVRPRGVRGGCLRASRLTRSRVLRERRRELPAALRRRRARGPRARRARGAACASAGVGKDGPRGAKPCARLYDGAWDARGRRARSCARAARLARAAAAAEGGGGRRRRRRRRGALAGFSLGNELCGGGIAAHLPARARGRLRALSAELDAAGPWPAGGGAALGRRSSSAPTANPEPTSSSSLDVPQQRSPRAPERARRAAPAALAARSTRSRTTCAGSAPGARTARRA